MTNWSERSAASVPLDALADEASFTTASLAVADAANINEQTPSRIAIATKTAPNMRELTEFRV